MLAERDRDGAGVGHSVNQLAILHWHQGDLDTARRLYLAAREHATRADDAALVAMTSTNLGVIASVRGEHDQARRDANEIAQQTRTLEADFLELARRWGESTESKDRYTQGHCERVADVSCRLATLVGLTDAELLWFRIGALLHDVG